MGGRSPRELERLDSDSSAWIRELSDTRLQSYDRLTTSAGFGSRADGSPRAHEQQSYFAGLVSSEKARRGLK